MDKFLNSAFIDQYGAALAPSFDFVNTSASAEVDVPREPLAVSAATQELMSDLGHAVVGTSDDELGIAVLTKKTLMSWELVTAIQITPSPQGSHVEVFLRNMPGRPKALLDGKKNKKVAQKLADQIRSNATGG